MIKLIFVVKDVKTSFWEPHVAVNEQSFVREFSNLINSRNEFTEANYGDLELWKLGTFDDATGEIVSDLVYVASGRDFYRKPNNDVKDGNDG